MRKSREILERLVAEEALCLLGVVSLSYPEEYDRFSRWLAESRHAGMAFMERHPELRGDPRQLLPGARAAVILGLPYYLGDSGDDGPRVAQYAKFPDYHRVLRKKGERIGRRLAEALEEEPAFRLLVDTAPVLERALAAKCAEGFIGKNTCYIHPERGSFLMLAELVTSLDLDLDERQPVDPHVKTRRGGCGNCKRCQTHCPTGALSEDYRLDANRCLAYWTIEHRGAIPEEFWPWLGAYYFGCDLCQLACPYNWRATGNRPPSDLPPRALPELFDVAVMGQADYERYFGGTPMTRAKRNGLRRNALIAMTVTKHPRLHEAIERARADVGSPVAETLAQIERYGG